MCCRFIVHIPTSLFHPLPSLHPVVAPAPAGLHALCSLSRWPRTRPGLGGAPTRPLSTCLSAEPRWWILSFSLLSPPTAAQPLRGLAALSSLFLLVDSRHVCPPARHFSTRWLVRSSLGPPARHHLARRLVRRRSAPLTRPGDGASNTSSLYRRSLVADLLSSRPGDGATNTTLLTGCSLCQVDFGTGPRPFSLRMGLPVLPHSSR